MIYSAKILSGFAASLPRLGERMFSFTQDINVVFGPNGTGKSTLLKTLAAYCCVRPNGGKPRFIEPGSLPGAFSGEKTPYPHACSGLTGCKADVDWNGALTLFYNPTEGDMPIRSFEEDDSDGFLGGFKGQLNHMFDKPSDGIKRAKKLIALRQILGENPDFAAKPTKESGGHSYDEMNDVWQAAFDGFAGYVAACQDKHKNDQRPTILLDEPDRSVSISNQCSIWASYLPSLVSKAQVIIVSHSPIALFVPGVNLIDLEDGYAAKSKKSIEDIVAGKPIVLPQESEESIAAKKAILSGLKD